MQDIPLRLIGTGFGRTGTESMRKALGMIGYGPCHHMMHLVETPENCQLWERFLDGDEIGWPALLDGCASCLDWPTAAFWRDLTSAYPDAKVILTWRDPEDWWRSFESTILVRVNATLAGGPASVSSTLLWRDVFKHDLSRENCIATYEANAAEVRATIAPDRLLVYELGSGWEPLCRFLDVPVPDAPYPRGNSTAEFRARFSDPPARER